MVWLKPIENQCAKALINPKSYLKVIQKVQKTNINIQKSGF